MHPVKPDAPTTPGWTEVTYAKEQPQYNQLPAIRDFNRPEGPVIATWEPDATEVEMIRRMIEEGRPVRISIEVWTFRQPYPPMRVTVGQFPEPYQAAVQDHTEPPPDDICHHNTDDCKGHGDF